MILKFLGLYCGSGVDSDFYITKCFLQVFSHETKSMPLNKKGAGGIISKNFRATSSIFIGCLKSTEMFFCFYQYPEEDSSEKQEWSVFF
jgi:hypothetical protein